jgi:hypothetical protein
VVCALVAGGTPGARTETVLVDYMRAVQDEDLGNLYCLSTGASADAEGERDEERLRADFEAWARAQYDLYLEGRDTGRVELNGEGIPAVKLFALGRGTFFTADPPVSPDDGVRLVETHLRLGYPAVDLSRLSPGTTFYLCGVPPGRVHPVRVPSGPQELSLEVLDSVTLEWTLVHSAPTAACAGGWTVAGVRPVETSVRPIDITWYF